MPKANKKSYPSEEDMFYSLPAVRRWVAKISEHCVIKELERFTNPDEMPIQIHGRVLEGNLKIGSYCTLNGQEGTYKIILMGWQGNRDECIPGQITKFTLKKCM